MKTKKNTLLLLYTLLIALDLVSFKVAAVIAQRHRPITRGVLGMLVLYLAYDKIFSVKEKNENRSYNEILLTFPDNIKSFLLSFFWVLMLYWATAEIIDMYNFLVDIW